MASRSEGALPDGAAVSGTAGADGSMSVDVASDTSIPKLQAGATGLPGVLFLAITGSAPLAVVLFNYPVSIGYGEEKGSPAGFLYATVLYALFAVGYVAMARRLTATGGFYSFISHGLGRPLALAAGFAMMASYALFAAELLGGVAAFANAKLAQYGSHPAWIIPSLVGVVLISALAWFDVRLSIKVLGVALISEVVLITIFTLAVFAHGGNHGISLGPINPQNIFYGAAPGIGIFFALISWVGTETVVNYGEESRDPRRIVPRATMIAVVGVGALYTAACWALVSAYGTGNEAAQAIVTGKTTVFGHTQSVDLSNVVLIANTHFTTHFFTDLISYLIITSSLACAMALNNVCVRYFYALGREGVLPRALGRTHPRHKTPHVAVLLQAVTMAVILVLFWAYDVTPFQVYAWLGIPALSWLMGVQALCSVSTIVYFRRYYPGTNPLATIVAPALACVGLLFGLYLLYHNLEFVAGGKSRFVDSLPYVGVAVPLLGLAWAYYLRARKPDEYKLLGRMINTGDVI